MEAGEAGRRSSNAGRFDPRPREIHDRYNREAPTMATATLIHPSSPYHTHHALFASGYSHSNSPTSIPSMIAPVEPRRSGDFGDRSHRQSLPSIQEVIGSTKAGLYGPVPSTTSAGQTLLPRNMAPGAPARSIGDASLHRQSSPLALHPPPSTIFPRPDTLPAFSDHMPVRPPSLNTYAGPHHVASHRVDQHDASQRVYDPQPSPHYQHPPSSLQPLHRSLPPGQMPLPGSAYSTSPASQSLPSPYSEQVRPNFGDEVYSYAESLHVIATSARSIYHFVDGYRSACEEQQGPQLVPSRLPTEAEVSSLLDNAIMIKKKLEDIREISLQTRLNSERGSHNGRRGYEDEESPMYANDSAFRYPPGDVKKRRGRAAPPGRCHSCNRVDTPEWRRGPDGARTLCNACGLHYAKLERKKHQEKTAIQKPMDKR